MEVRYVTSKITTDCNPKGARTISNNTLFESASLDLSFTLTAAAAAVDDYIIYL